MVVERQGRFMSAILSSRSGATPTDPAEQIAWLTAKCRSMRAKGLAGHWTYDKGLHSNLLTILAAERAALAAATPTRA
jgi:hypothetical protein